MATMRSSCGSRALYTVPKAPTPTVSISSNRPSRRWPPRGLQGAVDSRSSRKVEPQEGQTISPALRSRTSSIGLRHRGQATGMGLTPKRDRAGTIILQCRRPRASVGPAFRAGLGDLRLDPPAQDLSLEPGEERQQTGRGGAARGHMRN